MLPNHCRRLVIDASVACSCGGPKVSDPIAKNCRDFLNAMLGTSHKAVITPELHIEWRRHQSRFARMWRVSMTARRRIVNVQCHRELRSRITASCDPCDREEMSKDLHLIEAAMASDYSVISLDEGAKRIFKTLSIPIKEIRKIVWVNPTSPVESAITWLTNGARADPHRCLHYRP